MNKKTIVTHDLKFHTDDVFAVATILLMLKREGKTAEIIRTRDPEIIKTGDYVVDVGDVYDPSHNHFDHHQASGAGKRDNSIPYASFGLVWKQFGEMLCGNKEIAGKIDRFLVQPIDAHDNGISIFKSVIDSLEPYDIHSIRYAFLPTWKEGFENIDIIFLEMVAGAKKLLEREITWTQDIREAEIAIKETYENAKDKRLLIFDRYYPSDEYLAKIPEPLFIIFPYPDGTWIMKAVEKTLGSFVNRKDLPHNWGGKKDAELEKITGVSGSIFCHNNYFLVVAKTREAILKLAEIALNS